MYGYLEQGSTGVPPSVPFELPKNLFRYGEQTLWSTQLFAGGTSPANTNNRLFATPIGQVGQGFVNALSIGETNIKEGGRIPSGIAYDVFGIACQIGKGVGAETAGTVAVLGENIIFEADTSALLEFQLNGVLTWDFTQTQVDISLINLIGAGGGSFGTQATSNNAAASGTGTQNNGAGSVWLYRKHPVALPGNSTFSILARFGSRCANLPATYPWFLKVILLGYYKNVIEIG